MKSIFLVSSIAVVASALSQPIDSNAVIAKVDGQVINAAQFYRRMAYLDGVGTVENGTFVAVPPAFLTMQRMIDEMIVVSVAKDKGVAPTAAEIEAELIKRKKDNPAALKELQDLGVGDDMIRGQITQDLARFNLLTMGVTITDGQVQNNYTVNKMIYVTPATIKLRVIVVTDAASKTKVDEALKTKPFADVASAMSEDLTKMMGGDLPVVPVSNMPKNVADATATVVPGKATAWIESEGAFLKYLVEAKTEQKQLPLDAQLKADIKKSMMVVAGQQKNGEMVEKLIKDKRKATSVVITSPGLQKLWNLLDRR